MSDKLNTSIRNKYLVKAITILIIFAFAAGCANEAIEANRRQVEQNQALIEQTQKELAQMRAQQTYSAPVSTPGMPGTCDKTVEATATKRGGEAYAKGDLEKGLAYYQDALTACPGSAKADMNGARTYEALGNRESAIRYYTAAANSNGDAGSVQDAKAALSRLGSH